MVVVRIIVKIVLLPVRICLTMIQLVVMFFTWLSATVFHILSGIICITAVLGYGFGQETGTEAVRMLVAGFILYILPVLSGWAQKQEEAITKYCDQIFNSGAETEEFFYRLGLRDGMKLRKNVKMGLKQLSE